MAQKYDEEFKKQIVDDYMKGTSNPRLEKEYGVTRATIAGCLAAEE